MKRKKEDMLQFTKDVKLVTTWDGREIPRENCKRIDGEYYEVDVDCFLVENSKGEYKWTRKNTGRIAFNYELQKWELTKKLRDNPDYVEGIIDTNGNKGYFIINPYKNVVICDTYTDDHQAGIPCLNADIAIKMGYLEYFKTGCYVPKKTADKKALEAKNVWKYKGGKKLNYNADESNNQFLSIIQEYGKLKNKIPLGPNTLQAAKLFGNYTFGIEAESCNGFIPPQLLAPLGLVPLKDGSLRWEDGTEPYEYTTIPLSGTHGLETVKLQFQELSKRCEFNHKCSMHIHIGGITKRTEEFVIALYKLAYNIQDEVFLMFPDYKSYPERYEFHKNYCQKLPNLELDKYKFNEKLTPTEGKKRVKQAFDRIYWWASDQYINSTNEEWNLHTMKHPKGQMDKWNYAARYSWLNFNNYLFSHRETVEWRIHTPTFNYIKVTNWLFIVNAIVQFAEQFTNEILRDEVTFNLETILSCYKNYFFKSFYENTYSESVANYLIDYCKDRKHMCNYALEKGDGMGKEEFKKDSKYTFSSSGLNSLF